MTDDQPKAPNRSRHIMAVVLVVTGVLLLAGLVAFVWLAMSFGASFAGSYRPFEDLALGFAALSPIVIVALLLIGYGRHLLRKE